MVIYNEKITIQEKIATNSLDIEPLVESQTELLPEKPSFKLEILNGKEVAKIEYI